MESRQRSNYSFSGDYVEVSPIEGEDETTPSFGTGDDRSVDETQRKVGVSSDELTDSREV